VNKVQFQIRILSVLLIAVCCNAQARNMVGKISSIDIRNDGFVAVTVAGTTSGIVPACVSPAYASNWFVLRDAFTSPRAKQQLELLKMARLTQENITIFGTGSCDAPPVGWGDIESINEVVF
jgi:hypothetical protein